MKKILVHQAFSFSPDGMCVVEIEAGEQEVTERCAIVAVEHLRVASLVESGSAAEGEPPASGEPTQPAVEQPVPDSKPVADTAPTEQPPEQPEQEEPVKNARPERGKKTSAR